MQRYLVEFLFDMQGKRDIKGIDNLDDYIENPAQFVKRYKDPQFSAFFSPDNQGQVKTEKLKKSARDALTKLGELSIFDALETAGLTQEARKNLGMGNVSDAKEAIRSAMKEAAGQDEKAKKEAESYEPDEEEPCAWPLL